MNKTKTNLPSVPSLHKGKTLQSKHHCLLYRDGHTQTKTSSNTGNQNDPCTSVFKIRVEEKLLGIIGNLHIKQAYTYTRHTVYKCWAHLVFPNCSSVGRDHFVHLNIQAELGTIVWKNKKQSSIRVSSLTEKGDEPPAKLLDDLFLKTKAAPCIYWLPHTEEQVGFTCLRFSPSVSG